MNQTERRAWLGLALTHGLGGQTYRALLAAFGGPEQIYAAPGSALQPYLSQAAARRDLDRVRDLECRRLAQLAIHSRRRRLLVACDGEVEMLQQPLHYRSRPGALCIFAPART